MWINRLTLVLALWASPALAEGPVIFAAASLKGPLDAIAPEGSRISYGGSGALARQVMAGAPADVLILANEQWMDVVEADDHLKRESRRTILSNRLVLVSPHPAPVDLSAGAITTTLGAGRLAMGRTNSVPAGIYGKAALEALGLWEVVLARLAEVDSVRAALVLAERGEVPLALVYASDAKLSDAVFVVAEIPMETHPVIRYEAAVLADSAFESDFIDLLATSTEFVEAGFLPPPP